MAVFTFFARSDGYVHIYWPNHNPSRAQIVVRFDDGARDLRPHAVCFVSHAHPHTYSLHSHDDHSPYEVYSSISRPLRKLIACHRVRRAMRHYRNTDTSSVIQNLAWRIQSSTAFNFATQLFSPTSTSHATDNNSRGLKAYGVHGMRAGPTQFAGGG